MELVVLNTNSALEDLPKLTNIGEYGPLAEEASEATGVLAQRFLRGSAFGACAGRAIQS